MPPTIFGPSVKGSYKFWIPPESGLELVRLLMFLLKSILDECRALWGKPAVLLCNYAAEHADLASKE